MASASSGTAAVRRSIFSTPSSIDPPGMAPAFAARAKRRRAAAFEGGDRRPWGHCLSFGPVIGNVGLDVLELHLQLFDQPGMAFGAMAILLAPEFGDLQSKVPDHVFGGRDERLHLAQFVLGLDQSAFCGRRAGLCRNECGAQNSDLRCGLRHAEDLPRNPRIVQ